MSSEFRTLLEDHAFFVRAEAEWAWGPDTICDGYEFDTNNLPKGQCGNGRDHTANRLKAFTALAVGMDAVMRHGVWNTDLGKINTYEELFGGFSENHHDRMTFMASFAGVLGEKALMCEWGMARENKTGRVLADHCWLRVVDRKYMHDLRKGDYSDNTLDQYSRGDLLLPPIYVQSAAEQDGLVSYFAETSEEFGTHDLSRFRSKERMEIIDNLIRHDRYEPAQVFDPPPEYKQRIDELRAECLRAYEAS